MFETFDTDPTNDPNISEISFSDKQGKLTLEIIARNKKEAIALKCRIFGLRGIYEMDSPTYQNFTIECNEEKAIVTLSGNIFNALNILKENKLISTHLQSEISKNGNVTNFLRESSTFILPENIEKSPEAAKPNLLENISALQESYVHALAQLDPTQLEMALNSLANNLKSTGNLVEIKIQKNEYKLQAH